MHVSVRDHHAGRICHRSTDLGHSVDEMNQEGMLFGLLADSQEKSVVWRWLHDADHKN